jgi:hypothetical protein
MEDIVKSLHPTGVKYLMLVGNRSKGVNQATAYMTWDSSNMSKYFVHTSKN